MMKAILDVLMLTLFANQVIRVCGEVLVYRVARSSLTMMYTCVTEDDGGALVFNHDQFYPVKTDKRIHYSDKCKLNNKEINCKMDEREGCLQSWDVHHWNFTNSFETPMGPVFDERWEEFREYHPRETEYDGSWTNTNTTTTVFSFSVRATRDLHIILCNDMNGEFEKYCYWIIIGGWENTKSVIRRCPTEVPRYGSYPRKDSECSKIQVSSEHRPLSEFEWRTFVITWNHTAQNISVYDSNGVIMSYVDKQGPKSSKYSKYSISTRGENMLLRFHDYKFLYTTNVLAILRSPEIQLNNRAICIQLLIGLCAHCDADVVLRDSKTQKLLKIVSAKGSSVTAPHRLPMWQSIKIEIHSITYVDSVRIEVIPKLGSERSNPLWAIANIHHCASKGCFKIRSTSLKQWYPSDYLPNITCQKLFYEEHAVVNASSIAKLNVKLDNAICSNECTEPECMVSCIKELIGYTYYSSITICQKNGCTCAPGSTGFNCGYPCNPGTYDHDCKKTCGSCFQEESCDRITGACFGGCNNTEKRVYLPPLCQKGIDQPIAPEIISSNATNIVAVVPMTWHKEYKGLNLSYYCEAGEGKEERQQALKRIFPNTTQLIGNFENLLPATTYLIRCSLVFAPPVTILNGAYQHIRTTCDTINSFDITLKETSLTINNRLNKEILYPCPEHKYHVVVQNVNEPHKIISGFFSSFPYTLSDLKPYTSFRVSISNGYENLFSQEIRMLEGVPSDVLNLKSNETGNRLTLTWNPPKQPNGKIVRYEVVLKVEKYYGCQDFNLSSPSNHIRKNSTENTTITITELHPYANYSVRVLACNSRHCSTGITKIFITYPSELEPATTFNRLRFVHWNLKWDPPKDCTAIFGPMHRVKVKIQGVSNAVKNFTINKYTSNNEINMQKILYGAEQYVAKIYIGRYFRRRIINDLAHEEYVFETPPKAPPKVKNLEVVEVDNGQIIHLRWQSPLPPLNGKLSNYSVRLCYENNKNYCTPVYVQLNESCDLWDNYICTIVQRKRDQHIGVVAYNIDVSEPSLSAYVTEEMLNNTMPDVPRNYTIATYEHGVVDLKWLHPSRTGRHLRCFRIMIQKISSDLRSNIWQSPKSEEYEYSVTNYARNYTKRLYLLTSTRYNISIQTVTITNETSNTISLEVRTPSSIGLAGELEVSMQESDTVALLYIPKVLNDTRDSVTHILVIGPNGCERYAELPENLLVHAADDTTEYVWQAVERPTNELADKQFTIGDDPADCPLIHGQIYDIVIIIENGFPDKQVVLTRKTSTRKDGRSSSKYYEVWFICIILIFMTGGATFYFYER